MLRWLPDAQDFASVAGFGKVEQHFIASEILRRRWQCEVEKLHTESIAGVCVLARIGYHFRRIAHESKP